MDSLNFTATVIHVTWSGGSEELDKTYEGGSIPGANIERRLHLRGGRMNGAKRRSLAAEHFHPGKWSSGSQCASRSSISSGALSSVT